MNHICLHTIHCPDDKPNLRAANVEVVEVSDDEGGEVTSDA